MEKWVGDMRGKLEKYIMEAFEMLYKNDKHLINNMPDSFRRLDNKHHVGERSIVFRYAFYLQKLINEDEQLKRYHLDCEYNRNGIETKALPRFPNGTYPDLIIHKRGSNEYNLLVMEFKTYWNSDQKGDIEKIREFMDVHGSYKYKYGIAVLIGREKPIIDWISTR